MNRKWRMLLTIYQKALNLFLKQGPKASLRPALRIGRRAMVLGLETLDLALIHEQILVSKALSIPSARVRNALFKRARAFFAEAIVPMENLHRSALEASLHLNQLNVGLRRRTRDLATSNRELKKEIARRQSAEQTLRKSEQHTSLLLTQSQSLQTQLKQLSQRILSVQEEERKRISRESHDVIAQMLTGINVRLATLKNEAAANAKGLSGKISRTQRLVEKSVDIVHRFALELRPAALDDLGLIPALHSFLKTFIRETGIRASLTAFAGVEKLSGPKRTVLYRVAYEALTNVVKHAKANRVDIIIQQVSKAVRMQIIDDGQSFRVEELWLPKNEKHLGLLGMQERVEMVGGTFEIRSTPGKGTTVQVQIPFGNKARELSPS